MRERFNHSLGEAITSPEFHEEETDLYIEKIIADNPGIERELTELEQNENGYENGNGVVERIEGTRKHCVDVAELMLETSKHFPDLMKESGLEEEWEAETERWKRISVTAALLHDVGKNEIPGYIIMKPGKPTEEEWQQLRGHATLSRDIILDQIKDSLGENGDKEIIAEIVYRHHLKDGYPKQSEIQKNPDPSIERMIERMAAIIAILDNFDSLRSHRSYRDPEGDREFLVKYLVKKFPEWGEVINYLVDNFVERKKES